MPHPRFRGANAAYRTVYATFRHGSALQDLFRRAREPWTVLQNVSCPLQAVEGRIRTCEARDVGRVTRRRVAQHVVRKPASQFGTGSIGFRQNSGQSPDGAEGSRKALWLSEGIRPLPMRRNPKRRFRPTRAYPAQRLCVTT